MKKIMIAASVLIFIMVAFFFTYRIFFNYRVMEGIKKESKDNMGGQAPFKLNTIITAEGDVSFDANSGVIFFGYYKPGTRQASPFSIQTPDSLMPNNRLIFLVDGSEKLVASAIDGKVVRVIGLLKIGNDIPTKTGKTFGVFLEVNKLEILE